MSFWGLGSRGLNLDLQKMLNGNVESKITRFGSTYSPGDKIIQVTNNYDKEIFNGDIGLLKKPIWKMEQSKSGLIKL